MYAKLFSSILDSSVWTLPIPTRIVWIALLAMADRYGHVYSSRSGLARRALVSEEDCNGALETLLAPDPDSSDAQRNPENEGRRIEVADGGWVILNYPYYQAIKDTDARRTQVREAVRRYRLRQKNGNHVSDGGLTNDDQHHLKAPQLILTSAHLNSDSDQEEKHRDGAQARSRSHRERFVRPTVGEIEGFLAEKGILGVDARDFHAHYEAKGWVIGKSPMKNWKAAIITWERKANG